MGMLRVSLTLGRYMGGDVEFPSHCGGYMGGNVERFPHTGEGTWEES